MVGGEGRHLIPGRLGQSIDYFACMVGTAAMPRHMLESRIGKRIGTLLPGPAAPGSRARRFGQTPQGNVQAARLAGAEHGEVHRAREQQRADRPLHALGEVR